MSPAASAPRDRRISLRHLALTVPWVAIVIAAFGPIRDNSFLWHIRAGSVQTENGAVLTADPFSFTLLGEPWLTQSWLVEVLYGWAENVSGLDFVPYMILLIGCLIFVGIGLIAYQHSRSVVATVTVLVLSVLALVSFLVPRPVLFAYLLMTLAMLAWDRPANRWAIPLIFWIWAAVHASFVIGLGYVGLSLIMKREWRAVPMVLAASLATLFTAHGLGVVAFLSDFGANRAALQYLSEWRRPGLLEPLILPVLIGALFVSVGAFRRLISARHLWLLIPFIALAFTAVRAVPAAWLGLIPLVALSLSGLEGGSNARIRLLPALSLLLGVLIVPFLVAGEGGLLQERFPVEALTELEDVPTFHDDVVGGYLIWAGGPERKVYIDDRAELYGERLGELMLVRRGELEWEPVFVRDDIEQALLSSDEPLVADIEQAEAWEITYADENFTLLQSSR